MTTQQKQILYTPVDIDDADFEDSTREKTEEELDFEKFRDEMRETNQYAKITVSRQPTTSDGRPGQQKLIFLFECGMDEFSFSQLCSRCRDEYGTGTYRIQARNEKGQLKINKAIQVEVPKTSGSIADGNNPSEIITRFSEAMHNHQIRTEQMLRTAQGPVTGNDAFKQMTEMMTAMGSMMGAMGIKPAEAAPQKTLLEQMTEYKMMMELFGGNEGGLGGGGEANLYSLLTATMQSFGGPIAAAIAAGQADGSVNQHGLLTAPKPNPVEKPVNTESEIMQEQEKEQLKSQLKLIVANAKAGVDAQTFATIVVEKTPEEMADKLYDFLSGDDWLEQLIFLNEEVDIYKEWFTAWRDQVLLELTEPDNPELDEAEVLHSSNISVSTEMTETTEATERSEPSDLTDTTEGAQNRQAVAGSTTGPDISDTADSNASETT